MATSVQDIIQGSRGGSYQTSSSTSTSETRIVPGMMKVYNQLLDLNQKNYNNVLSIYQQGSQQLASQLPGIYAGYTDLENRVMSTLGMGEPLGGNNWGVAQPAARQIQRDFAQTQGDTQQAMINAGLGNSTVLGNFRNQNTRMTGEAFATLGANLANYAAGYQRDIGLAQQAARMQGAQLQSNYALGGASTLAGYQFQNTAGPLTGQFSTSTSNSSGYSLNPYQQSGGNSMQQQYSYNPSESIARERNQAQQQMAGMAIAARSGGGQAGVYNGGAFSPGGSYTINSGGGGGGVMMPAPSQSDIFNYPKVLGKK